ncbi:MULTISPECIES: type II toxin-antitoxin system HigA family antitoxin [unclassified Oceanispirochaeta]|uniref:helix-turn-helix domain-containing protein n=1 Tax=unclassified Oceanispirochaeta TaxID=2635722 RepID=UPI000E092212|nr:MULTISPECIES: transcriptional regulator [unclassified Oceanispirochaeta]MBF9018922.1 transcriptional regulator [Oceanispirochaeta sp. M2]NPD75421.1 transcriptional regulator [Oceanispirochaeta sp. M1]RDG28721.1 transcriptional regulator [Oceanispirochaeta sp. M1]
MSYALPKEEEFNAFLTALQIRSELDYEERLKQVERLMDMVNAGQQEFTLMVDYISKLIEGYEELHYPIGESTPARMLAFFMEEHGHKQSDLTDVAQQSVISDLLSGKREFNLRHIRKLAEKYHTNPTVFI